jgi:hypothetical protein
MDQQAFQEVSPNSPEAIPTQMRQIEGREWWLWGFAVAVTLALTLGMIGGWAGAGLHGTIEPGVLVQSCDRRVAVAFVQGLPALADVWPEATSDFTYRRLPDETLENVKCRVLESQPKKKDGAYDRIVTVLTPDSNVALEKRWLRGEKVVRVDRVAVADIDTTQGRPYARRREIQQSGGGPAQIVVVGNFSLDPVLPDQLFTSSNLRIGRFPSY